MKHIHFFTSFVFLFFILNRVHAQAPVIQWQKCLGGTNIDRAYSVAASSNGNYGVIGISNSKNSDGTSNLGGFDCFVTSVSSSGNINWTKSMGGSGDDNGYCITSTSDGGFVAAGSTNSKDIPRYHGNYTYLDYLVIKFDAAGNTTWQKCFGGSSIDEAYSVKETKDGGYIVAGYSQSIDGDVSGRRNNGDPDYWVIKLDRQGNIEWERSYGGTNKDEAYSIQTCSDGGYIVAGISYSFNGDLTKTYGLGDGWVVKLTSTGVIQWQKNIGGSSYDELQSVQQTKEGGYIVAGLSLSNDGGLTGNHGLGDYLTVKLTSSGSLEWQRLLGGSNAETGKYVELAADSGYIVGGGSVSNNGDISGNHGSSDACIIKLNKAGVVQWQKCYGGSGGEWDHSLCFTADNGMILVGFTRSNDGDVMGNNGGGEDAWVVKLADAPCTPTLNIYSASPTICSGTPITFTATATNTGTSPIHQWKVNNANTGTNSSTFTSSALNNNDVITCELTSNAPCATTPTVTSNSIKLTVNPSPVVAITGDTCVGSVLTINSNLAPATLVWKLNNNTTVSTQTAGISPNAVTVAGGNGGGTNANQLNAPNRLFIDASGNMYIPDMANARIQKWAPGATAGVTVAGGNGVGSAPNQFDRPTSVALDSKGNLYVTDQSNSRIQKWAPGATTGVTFASGLSSPTGIFIDANDNIYVSQQNNSSITKYPAGSTTGVTVFGFNGYGSAQNQLSTPTGIFVDASGSIYMCDTDNNRVQKWTPGNNNAITVAGGNGAGSATNQLYNPLGVFVDNYGNIYISDYNNARVQKWAPGAISGVTVAGGNGLGTAANQLNRPAGLWVDAKGDLYVSDFNNYRVQKFANSLTTTYTPPAPGSYTATVTSTNGCSATSNALTVVALKTPKVSITSNTAAICQGVPVTFTASNIYGGTDPLYQWKINGTNTGTSSNNSTLSTTTIKAGDVVTCVITSNADLCLTSKTATSNSITLTNASTGVASVTISATETSICEGSIITFTAAPSNGGSSPTYLWKVNGVNALSTGSATFTPALKDGDVVSCTITSSATLCPSALTATSNSIPIQIAKVPLTSMYITANDTVICTGSTVNFTAASINSGSNPTYQWKVNGINAGTSNSSYSTNLLKNGDVVNCSVTSNMQCAVTTPVISNNIKMTVDLVPVISIRPDTIIFQGSSIKLNTNVTGNIASYTWSPSTTLNNSSIASPVATPIATTTYKLQVTTRGDCYANGQVTITAITEVIIANAFSPNNDGINDVWNIPGLSSYKDCSVQIFNRYGQLLFQSRGYNKPWDGTFKGHPVPVATYYYIIATDHLHPNKTGSITILR